MSECPVGPHPVGAVNPHLKNEAKRSGPIASDELLSSPSTDDLADNFSSNAGDYVRTSKSKSRKHKIRAIDSPSLSINYPIGDAESQGKGKLNVRTSRLLWNYNDMKVNLGMQASSKLHKNGKAIVSLKPQWSTKLGKDKQIQLKLSSEVLEQRSKTFEHFTFRPQLHMSRSAKQKEDWTCALQFTPPTLFPKAASAENGKLESSKWSLTAGTPITLKGISPFNASASLASDSRGTLNATIGTSHDIIHRRKKVRATTSMSINSKMRVSGRAGLSGNVSKFSSLSISLFSSKGLSHAIPEPPSSAETNDPDGSNKVSGRGSSSGLMVSYNTHLSMRFKLSVSLNMSMSGLHVTAGCSYSNISLNMPLQQVDWKNKWHVGYVVAIPFIMATAAYVRAQLAYHALTAKLRSCGEDEAQAILLRRDARAQQRTMVQVANRIKMLELQNNGLVIVEAWYMLLEYAPIELMKATLAADRPIENDPLVRGLSMLETRKEEMSTEKKKKKKKKKKHSLPTKLNVRIPLQALVSEESTLCVTDKCLWQLDGFYDLRIGIDPKATPVLFVRYTCNGVQNDVVFSDNDDVPVKLPLMHNIMLLNLDTLDENERLSHQDFLDVE